jgi:hypothetical protein
MPKNNKTTKADIEAIRERCEALQAKLDDMYRLLEAAEDNYFYTLSDIIRITDIVNTYVVPPATHIFVSHDVWDRLRPYDDMTLGGIPVQKASTQIKPNTMYIVLDDGSISVEDLSEMG